MKTFLLAAAAVLASTIAMAGDSDLTAIQDNSFLIEEAYNQETGVVQHISFFMRDRRDGNWTYAFTQEWPVRSQTHQFSYTIPMVRDTERGVGDVMLNYRYQLIGNGDAPLAISPRVSIVLPTGDEAKGTGRGSTGVQLALPVSKVLGARLVAHTNAGATWFRNAGSLDIGAGQSVIYALSARVHLMAEATWSRVERENETLISPGVRWAWNTSRGMQIVPGIAFPIGVGGSAGKRSVVAYLSFEHPFGDAR